MDPTSELLEAMVQVVSNVGEAAGAYIYIYRWCTYIGGAHLYIYRW